MQSQSDYGPHLSISAEDGDVLRSLLDWLRHEDALRGRVRTAHSPVRPGEMGGVLDVLVVALGSGGAGAVLAASVSTWLSQPRRADVKLTVTAENGRHIELDARRIRDPAVLLREVERLLRTESPSDDPAAFPDPARSRAVLIGASHFTAAGLDLPDIPAVEANLTALRQVLTSPDTGVLRPEFCRVLIDPTSTDEVGAALSDAAATDLLLVYYAGHGLMDDSGRLHLALAHTHPHRARWTALPLELLREEIANSAAATRVLVLDCCFSGRAIEAMADDQGVISGQLEVAGTYTLTSTTANAPSHAPAGDRHTAFTGALLRALDDADPLTLDQIYVTVDRDLAARNLPRPQRRAVNTAGNLALSRGPATRSHTEPPDSDTVRFTPAYRPPTREALRVFGAVFRILGFYFLNLFYCLAFLFVIFLIFFFIDSLPSRTDSYWALVFTALAPLIPIAANIARPRTSGLGKAVSVIKNSVSGETDVRMRELVIDRSGLTIKERS